MRRLSPLVRLCSRFSVVTVAWAQGRFARSYSPLRFLSGGKLSIKSTRFCDSFPWSAQYQETTRSYANNGIECVYQCDALLRTLFWNQPRRDDPHSHLHFCAASLMSSNYKGDDSLENSWRRGVTQHVSIQSVKWVLVRRFHVRPEGYIGCFRFKNILCCFNMSERLE